MKKYLFLIVIGLAAYAFLSHPPGDFSIIPTTSPHPSVSPGLSTSDAALQAAFENQQQDFQVGGSGRVVKILPDDDQGRRHQRFIIALDSGQTILIAHNIDLAPRVRDLRVGDHVNFYGVYEWNERGGVVHWTHHDPDNRHEGGWLNHGGTLYQ